MALSKNRVKTLKSLPGQKTLDRTKPSNPQEFWAKWLGKKAINENSAEHRDFQKFIKKINTKVIKVENRRGRNSVFNIVQQLLSSVQKSLTSRQRRFLTAMIMHKATSFGVQLNYFHSGEELSIKNGKLKISIFKNDRTKRGAKASFEIPLTKSIVEIQKAGLKYRVAQLKSKTLSQARFRRNNLEQILTQKLDPQTRLILTAKLIQHSRVLYTAMKRLGLRADAIGRQSLYNLMIKRGYFQKYNISKAIYSRWRPRSGKLAIAMLTILQKHYQKYAALNLSKTTPKKTTVPKKKATAAKKAAPSKKSAPPLTSKKKATAPKKAAPTLAPRRAAPKKVTSTPPAPRRKATPRKVAAPRKAAQTPAKATSSKAPKKKAATPKKVAAPKKLAPPLTSKKKATAAKKAAPSKKSPPAAPAPRKKAIPRKAAAPIKYKSPNKPAARATLQKIDTQKLQQISRITLKFGKITATSQGDKIVVSINANRKKVPKGFKLQQFEIKPDQVAAFIKFVKAFKRYLSTIKKYTSQTTEVYTGPNREIIIWRRFASGKVGRATETIKVPKIFGYRPDLGKFLTSIYFSEASKNNITRVLGVTPQYVLDQLKKAQLPSSISQSQSRGNVRLSIGKNVLTFSPTYGEKLIKLVLKPSLKLIQTKKLSSQLPYFRIQRSQLQYRNKQKKWQKLTSLQSVYWTIDSNQLIKFLNALKQPSPPKSTARQTPEISKTVQGVPAFKSTPLNKMMTLFGRGKQQNVQAYARNLQKSFQAIKKMTANAKINASQLAKYGITNLGSTKSYQQYLAMIEQECGLRAHRNPLQVENIPAKLREMGRYSFGADNISKIFQGLRPGTREYNMTAGILYKIHLRKHYFDRTRGRNRIEGASDADKRQLVPLAYNFGPTKAIKFWNHFRTRFLRQNPRKKFNFQQFQHMVAIRLLKEIYGYTKYKTLLKKNPNLNKPKIAKDIRGNQRLKHILWPGVNWARPKINNSFMQANTTIYGKLKLKRRAFYLILTYANRVEAIANGGNPPRSTIQQLNLK